MKHISLLLGLLLLVAGCTDNPSQPTNPVENPPDEDPPPLECTDGLSDGQYPCQNIDLVAKVSVDELMGEPLSNGVALNDIWGWTDPQDGTEYALVGLNDGVTFVDISTPSEPVVVGKLNETESMSQAASKVLHDEGKSTWRDFKIYENYLFVVSDAQPHGLQIFDLTQLRDVEDPPVTFSEDARYDEFTHAHNIAINTDEPYAYVVGSDTYGGGLHIVDISNPMSPTFAGFHSDSTVGRDSTGYVHDTQCVTYQGPDTDYQGEEVCMNASETHLVVANVTDKQNTNTIAKATYDGNAYAHQGWLTEDHRYFLLDDELDERAGSHQTTTYIWDVQDLDNPQMIGRYISDYNAIDHNQYVKGNYVYQANYTSGVRILSLDNVANGELTEVAYFDTYPTDNRAEFFGTWSTYPYFESGIVVASDITTGLFILKPDLQ